MRTIFSDLAATSAIALSLANLFFDALLAPVKQSLDGSVVVDELVGVVVGLVEQLLRAEPQNVVDLLLGEVGLVAVHSGLDHQMGQHHLLLSHLGHSLLHRVPGHEPVDHHLVLLPNPVSSGEGLVNMNENVKWWLRDRVLARGIRGLRFDSRRPN